MLRNKPHPLCRKCNKEKQETLVENREKERAAHPELPTEKECKGCHQIKPISEFNISMSYKDGLHSHCKPCVIKKSQELKQRWEKRRKNAKSPKEKLCTRCYRTFPIKHFCSSISTKDGFGNICKDCLKKQRNGYATRWIEARKKVLPKEKKKCPGCNRTLPVTDFYSHETLKDGLNIYCIECSKRMRIVYVDKWEQQRESATKTPSTKECNICHRILSLHKFYQNRLYKDGYSGTCIACEKLRSRDYIQQWEKEGATIPEEKQCQSCKQILSADHFRRNKRKKDGLDYLCKECSRLLLEQYSLRWSKERDSQKQIDFTLFPIFEKTCSICHETKPLTMFYPRKNSKDGCNASCKECNRKNQRLYIEKQKKLPKIIPENKFCTACKRLLPASKFSKSGQRKDGLYIYCRKCQNKKHKEYLSRSLIKESIAFMNSD